MENIPQESQDHEDLVESVETDNLEGAESVENSVSVSESTSTLMSSPGRKQFMMAINKSIENMDPVSLLKPVQQCIYCKGDDKQSSFSVYGNDVSVFPSDQDIARTTASNKIRISQVCKFDWEQRYHYGNLVASNKTYIAYVVGIKTNRHEHVRVINHHTSSRVLLKGFEGKVTDIEFGGPEENHLACMDMRGNLRIFILFEEDGLLKHNLLLEIVRPDAQDNEFCLVSWAPILIDEDNEDEEHELMVSVSRREAVTVFSVNTIVKSFGSHCSIDEIADGIKRIENGHSKPITNMVISPNLEVLATSSLDGRVKFWDINFENGDNPSCLHEWQPHDGEPVTSLFFCDNHFARDESSSSWRFLITGSNYSTELKVWCAVSWKCLQIIRFAADPNLSPSEDRNPLPCLKPVLDKSAKYFILTDIKRSVLYLMQLYQNSQEGTAHFTSLTECILTQPMLNFSLYDTKAIKKNTNEKGGMNDSSDNDDADDDEEEEEENNKEFNQNGTNEHADDEEDLEAATPRALYSVSLKMFAMHTKALQKLHIKYTPSCSVPPATPSVCTAVSSDDPMSVRDAMSDITEGQSSLASDLEDGDSFATANLKAPGQQNAYKAQDIAQSSVSSITTVTGIQSPMRSEEAKGSVEDFHEDDATSDQFFDTHENTALVDMKESVTDYKHDTVVDESQDSVTDKSHDSVSGKSHDFVTDKSHDSVSGKSHDFVTDKSHDSVSGKSHDFVTDKSHDSVTDKSHDSVSGKSHDFVTDKSHDSVSGKSHDSVTDTSHDSVSGKSHDSMTGPSYNPPREEARPVLAESSDAKPRTGTFTILKRPTPDTNQNDKIENKVTSLSSSASESQTKAKESKTKRRTEGKAVPAKPKEVKKTAKNSNQDFLDKNEKKGRADRPYQDYDMLTTSRSTNSSLVTIATGDLLGLDVASNSSREEKEPGSDNEKDSSSEVVKMRKPDDARIADEPLERILSALQQQQQHIMQLTATVDNLNDKLKKQTQKTESANQKQAEEIEQIKVVVQLLQKNSSSNLGKAVKEVSKACSQRLDNFTSSVQNSLQQTQERHLQMLLQAVNNSVTGKLDKLVKSEMKTTVLPGVQRLVTVSMDQISNFVAEKLAAVEKTLREEVSHLVRSKNVAESIGFTAAAILEGTLPSAYRDAFQNVLIPSYEDACKEMFSQINKAFQKGTKSYFDKLDNYFESSKQRQIEMRDPVLNQIEGLVQTLEDTADRLTGSESNLEALMEKQIKETLSRSRSDFLSSFDERISQGVLPVFKNDILLMLQQLKDDLNAFIRSSAQSGQVAVESSYFANAYENIDKFIEDCDYENAFKTALTAADLSVVVYACQKVDHEDLFTKHGSSLNQPIILSLIQQLSADLSNDTEIKGNYLLAATCELDHKNEITAEHMPSVLGNLIEQADKAIQLMKQNDPDNQNIKQLKSLSQIANKLLML